MINDNNERLNLVYYKVPERCRQPRWQTKSNLEYKEQIELPEDKITESLPDSISNQACANE